MWNDVRLTEHRLQIRASDIKVHNRWLNFDSLTSGPSFIAKWSYRFTHRVARAVKKADKLNILICGAEANWKLKARSSACVMSVASHASYLGERDDVWQASVFLRLQFPIPYMEWQQRRNTANQRVLQTVQITACVGNSQCCSQTLVMWHRLVALRLPSDMTVQAIST